ncbi:1-deoxy-D-xylulose 5-phosphate reductoisomerase [uncultured archaeon]|nr:1-deoxy-D-xylulose 5-phosphate reductoisomerase [uncultured archaeon]
MKTVSPIKKLSVLGLGSISMNVIDVVERNPRKFRIVALASLNEVELMEQQALKLRPEAVSLSVPAAANELENRLRKRKETRGIKVHYGSEGLMKIATHETAGTVVTAVVGSVGLLPTLGAIKAGKNVAVANKETLVCAGSIIMPAVKRHGVTLMPIDSEHSAIFQCLNGERRKDLKKIIITCSGGPFWTTDEEKMNHATKEEALNHPTWKMGGKITIDSATLMNKGLEVIEAHWLYDVPYNQIKVTIHPQSIDHSMVEFCDGSVIVQRGVHDMRVPILYALSYPSRLNAEEYAFLGIPIQDSQDGEEMTLNFMKPDMKKFPCLAYAYEAGVKDGTMPAVMNAANEVAVAEFFLKNRCSFGDIARVVRKTMDDHTLMMNPGLGNILSADKWAREHARSILDVVETDGSWKNIR